jgi:hypothetical protein
MVAPPTAQQLQADWYVSPGGNIWRATGVEADMLKYAAGWQGPMTYAQAEQVAGTTPGPERAVNKAATQVGTDVAGAGSGLNDIGDFFHRLTEGSTWTRVGEVVLGGILLYAGIRALTRGATASPTAKPVTSPVRKAAKVAVPEARLATRVAAKRVAPKTTARVASHRARVAKYGAKKPYSAPSPRPPTTRVSHIYHHKAGPKKVTP